MNLFQRIASWFKPAPVETPPQRRINYIEVTEKWEHLKMWIEGEDIMVQGTATAFGGDNDSMDNGETASGYNTKGNPDLLGVALPMRNSTVYTKGRGYVLAGSPIPKMPFGILPSGKLNLKGAFVDVTFPNGVTIPKIPVIDLGPAAWTKDAIDLSVGLARKYKPKATANNFGCGVVYRIRGGARYLNQ